jgi:hypothetical protein
MIYRHFALSNLFVLSSQFGPVMPFCTTMRWVHDNGFGRRKHYAAQRRDGHSSAQTFLRQPLFLHLLRNPMGTAVDVLPQTARLGSVEQPFPTNIEIGLFSVRVRLIAFS